MDNKLRRSLSSVRTINGLRQECYLYHLTMDRACVDGVQMYRETQDEKEQRVERNEEDPYLSGDEENRDRYLVSSGLYRILFHTSIVAPTSRDGNQPP